MKHTERLAWSLIATCTLSGIFAACAAVGEPKNEEQAQQIVAQVEEGDRAKWAALLRQRDDALETPDPSDDIAAETALNAHEDAIVQKRLEELGSTSGGLLGTVIPGLGPIGSALGLVVAGNFAPAVLSGRGRTLLRQAIRSLGPTAPGAEGSLSLVDALREISRAMGWGHSTEASEAAAEITIGQPEAVRIETALRIKAVAPRADEVIVQPVKPSQASIELRRDLGSSLDQDPLA